MTARDWEHIGEGASYEQARELIPQSAARTSVVGSLEGDAPYSVLLADGGALYRIARAYPADPSELRYDVYRTEGRVTPGQAAYEEEVRGCPTYLDGTPRKPWSELTRWARETWERLPRGRRRSTIELWEYTGREETGCKSCVDHRGHEGFNPCPCRGFCKGQSTGA